MSPQDVKQQVPCQVSENVQNQNQQIAPYISSRHSNGAGSSHQYAVGCADAGADGGAGASGVADASADGVGEDNEGRSSLWQISNDAETEVIFVVFRTSIE